MKRAYVFVLREKQAALIPEVEPFHERFMADQPEDAEDYTESSISNLRLSLNQHFGVDLSNDQMQDAVGWPETLAGMIAEQLLRLHPPENMIPKSSGLDEHEY